MSDNGTIFVVYTTFEILILMNRLHTNYWFLLILGIFISCQKDEPSGIRLDEELTDVLLEASQGGGLEFFRLPASDNFADIPQDPNNPLSEAKVELGKHLYHETGLAIRPKYEEGRFTYSCSSCHHSRAGFQAGKQQGIGEGGIGFGLTGEGRVNNAAYLIDSLDVQPIRTPTVLNTAYQEIMLWNGQFGATGMNVGTEAQWAAGTPKETNHLGYEGIEIQAIAGLKVHRMDVDASFCEETDYKAYFEKAFPGLGGDELYNRETAGLAIAAYERTVLANRAPFQKWLAGDRSAMFEREKRGAILFFGKAQCSNCHTGPALNEMAFYALAMPDLEGPGVYGTSPDKAENLGRGGFTKVEADNYKFKVPQLYNLKDSPFLGHGGTFRSVREVVEYKNAAIPANAAVPSSQLAAQFQPLNLTSDEIEDLTAFIENALRDPDLERYNPSALPSGFCFPNNDVRTRSDLGCQ